MPTPIRPMKAARDAKHLSLAKLAKKVGVSSAQLSRIENAGVKALETPLKIVKALDGAVTLEEVCMLPKPRRQRKKAG